MKIWKQMAADEPGLSGNYSEDRAGNNGSKNRSRGNEDLPGYPHYPSSEDIMNPANGAKKVSADPDEINRNNAFQRERNTSEEQPMKGNEDFENDDDLRIVPGTEADVTKEDLMMLGPKEGDMDMGDDELIRGKFRPMSMGDNELDIPGAELDDENEDIGEEDEENNYYSLGGDNKEGLEEDNQQEPE